MQTLTRTQATQASWNDYTVAFHVRQALFSALEATDFDPRVEALYKQALAEEEAARETYQEEWDAA